MKPDKRTCLSCGKDITDKSARAKFCSDKCTKAYKRNSDKLGQKEPIKSDEPNSDTENGQVGHELGQTDDLRFSLTKTDKTFYDRAMKDFGEPYYNFTGELRKEKCGYCQKPYETNLALNRYCSYEHYHASLVAV